jgi:vitamin K-dependent gamma-carboxylase-like protein
VIAEPTTLRRCWVRTVAFSLGPVDPIALDTFRVALGLSFFVYVLAWWQGAEEWLTPAGFHISSVAAGILGPVAPLVPRGALPFFGLLLFGSTLLLIVGWKLRYVTWIVFALAVYVTYADLLTAFTLNRIYIAAFLVLALVPQGSYWSIERRAPRMQPAWPLRILQATIVIQYFTAGWCKAAHGDWLQNPNVLWTQAQGYYRTDFAALMLRLLPLGAWTLMQHATLTFELLVPLLFLVRRLRPIGLLWGLAFQVLSALMLDRLVYFGLQLLSFYVLFLDDAVLHRLHARVFERGGGMVPPAAAPSPTG